MQQDRDPQVMGIAYQGSYIDPYRLAEKERDRGILPADIDRQPIPWRGEKESDNSQKRSGEQSQQARYYRQDRMQAVKNPYTAGSAEEQKKMAKK